MTYSPTEIKSAMVAIARTGEVATRRKAIVWLDDMFLADAEAEAEAEAYAEFGMSWVHGGGSASDVPLAWIQYKNDQERARRERDK